MSKANLFPTAVGPKPCAAGHMGPQVSVLPERWGTEPTPLSQRTERGKAAALHMGPQVSVLPERWDTEPTPLTWRTERGKAAAQSGPQVSDLPKRRWVYYPQTEGRQGKLQPDTGGLKFLSCERWDTKPTTLTLRTERGKLQPECGPQPPNCSIQPGVQTISFPSVWLPASFTKSLLYSVQQLWFNGYCLVTLAPSFTPLPHPSDGRIFQGTQMWPFWKLLLHHSTSRAQSQGSPPAIP